MHLIALKKKLRRISMKISNARNALHIELPQDSFVTSVISFYFTTRPAPEAETNSHCQLPQSGLSFSCIFLNTGALMALTIRLDPALETRVDQEAKRLGITKSEFVKDAIERVLGIKNPAVLLKMVRSRKPMGNTDATENVSARMRSKLGEKRSN